MVAKECECSDPRIVPRLLGCRREDVARLRNGGLVQTITVIRYAESPPSHVALEREVRKVCQASAALLSIHVDCDISPAAGVSEERARHSR